MTTDPRIQCKTCGDWGEVAIPTGPMEVELSGLCPEPGCQARAALERGMAIAQGGECA